MRHLILPLIVAALALSFTCQVEAQQIIVDVSGGTGGTPLSVEVVSGGTFTATADDGGLIFVVLEDFWDNGQSSFSHTGSTATVGLNGSFSPAATGAGDSAGFELIDLLFGFESVPAFSASDGIPLTFHLLQEQGLRSTI